MRKVKKASHGGKREGAGRKPTLKKATLTIIRLEDRQLKAIDHYAKEAKIPNRSAAVRAIVDEVTQSTEESDNDGAKS